MKRVMLKVSYDGTAYHGYQIQDNAPTIEGKLHDAIADLTGEDVTLIGGSRTDAGVHALCNVAVFDTDTKIETSKLPYALNVRLPDDIRVMEAADTAPDFHPRHTGSRKTYEYSILNSEFMIPIKKDHYLHIYNGLSLDKMKEAASYLKGEHDFAAFCSAGAQVSTTVRTIYDISVKAVSSEGEELLSTPKVEEIRAGKCAYITISVTGNGFLYNMVRIIAGTLIEVGRGNMRPEAVSEALVSLDRQKAGPTAPPCGLCLVKYTFFDT